MQLTLYTDYSLRVLLYLGLKKERATIDEIANAFRISRAHLVKVVHALSRRGYVHSARGPGGGVELAKAAEKVRIGRFVYETEARFDIVECFDPERNTCPIAGVCRLEEILRDAKTAFLSSLDRYTLADLIQSPRGKDPRRPRLGLDLP